jgi:hypothetical protein
VCSIEEQFGEPLENLLDLERVGFLEVGGGEGDADVADAAGGFFVWLLVFC